MDEKGSLRWSLRKALEIFGVVGNTTRDSKKYLKWSKLILLDLFFVFFEWSSAQEIYFILWLSLQTSQEFSEFVASHCGFSWSIAMRFRTEDFQGFGIFWATDKWQQKRHQRSWNRERIWKINIINIFHIFPQNLRTLYKYKNWRVHTFRNGDFFETSKAMVRVALEIALDGTYKKVLWWPDFWSDPWCWSWWSLVIRADGFGYMNYIPIGSMYGIYANIWGILMAYIAAPWILWDMRDVFDQT